MSNRNAYDILGVPPSASSAEIRKAYLKLSLKHHPDKNPENEEQAKAKFVEIGSAYEILSDPTKRTQYDRELLMQSSRNSGGGRTSGTTSFHRPAGSASESSASYDMYRDFFDSTVAGMSEEELAAAVGAATLVGGLVGSIIGSRLASGGNAARSGGAGGAGGLLASVGGLVGSAVASEMAASSVRALHQQSMERLQYKEECRRAVERGQPIPDPPQRAGGKWDDVLRKTMDVVKTMAQQPGEQQQQQQQYEQQGDTNARASDERGGTRGSSMNDFWKKAQAGVQAATAAHAARNAANRV